MSRANRLAKVKLEAYKRMIRHGCGRIDLKYVIADLESIIKLLEEDDEKKMETYEFKYSEFFEWLKSRDGKQGG